MSGSTIKIDRLKSGDYMMLRFEERRGDRVLRTLWTVDRPTAQDCARIEAFINARGCDCGKKRRK